ncbi:MAG: glycosyltransferase family 2 protein [Paludibacter sp.]|nr:glycosyltransferase family 2 protein [Bacteroidales bacterium]MCM1069217.1 glycosyltransferase family 2 protein [Prevotella sp.]MCM1354363.1 glycosyltransferase family 2 protein [Bacteroides sp.]MCM1443177.1 glycosyltransferase family 2 protein [Muribaculum sp.]MCM1481772.1 glycosyltransferase family 2 protein [Paludibacter sp.]
MGVRISIVVPTYNRCSMLSDTLRSLVAMRADAHDWECIIVNNNSTDDTEHVVNRFLAHEGAGYKFRMVKEEIQGLSAARNRGIHESAGDLIAFIDDDERVNEGFIESYLSVFKSNTNISAASGKVIAEYVDGRPEWMSPLLEKPIAFPVDLGEKVKDYPKRLHPAGGNMVVSRSVLEQVGGFNPELGRKGESLIGGEEYDLVDRIRIMEGRIVYVPGAVIYHRIEASKLCWDYLDRLTYMIGVGQRKHNGSVVALYGKEILKWCVCLLLSLFYIAEGKAIKGRYLMRMRRNVLRGIAGCSMS